MPTTEEQSKDLAKMSLDALTDEVTRLRAELAEKKETLKTMTETQQQLNDFIKADMGARLRSQIKSLGSFKDEELKNLSLDELQIKLDALKHVIPQAKNIHLAGDEQEEKQFFTVGDLHGQRFKMKEP